MKKILIAVPVVATLLAYTLLPGGEEGAVRDKIRGVAERLSAPAGEEPLARAGRFASLRSSFTSDVRVVLPGEQLFFHTFEELAGFAARAVPPGGILVQTEDIEVKIQANRQTADARFSARVLERRADGQESVLDARTVALTLVRHDQSWRIASARIMPSDDANMR